MCDAPSREKKDIRVPVMMSKTHVEKIDDWAFSRRIRSRGEAIRLLVEIGLSYEAESNGKAKSKIAG